MSEYPKYMVAAVQAAPVYLDLDASTEKACRIIREAANNGAKIIAFGEAFLPGYPWWVFHGDPFVYGLKFWERLYKNSVEIPSQTVSRLSASAMDNDIYVSISVTEKDRGSLYLTQLWFDNCGNLIGKHRKIKPTAGERTIWGEGDGSMMPVFDTKLGRLGGLQCWEHRMPGNLLAMSSMNEQVHVAAWPTGAGIEDHLFSLENNVNASMYYAATNGVYVLMSTQIFSEEMKEMLGGVPQIVGEGHAGIISPNGTIISESIPKDQEGIAYAEIDLNNIIQSKYFIDPAGHYSKPNVCSVVFNQSPQDVVTTTGFQRECYMSGEDLQKESKNTSLDI